MPSLSPSAFAKILTRCAALGSVRQEVINNHDDNRWWPLSISDWRLRMLIAGLSTRVSYSMISSYRAVIFRLDEIGYSRLCELSDRVLMAILRPLGLRHGRLEYCRSVMQFVDQVDCQSQVVKRTSNDQLIELIVREVKGAEYKVAQCCVLYIRGYYCGVMPVDSGMRDKLSLCMGIRVPRTALGHEYMRKKLERLVAETDCHSIAMRTGYQDLKLPSDCPLTWWAHLVLIYYKRLYCNRPQAPCPLRGGDFPIIGRCKIHI
jgi:hypothetical protein